MKKLMCRDAGMNCDFVAEGKNDDEIIQKAKDHGVKAHNMQVTPELEDLFRAVTVFIRATFLPDPSNLDKHIADRTVDGGATFDDVCKCTCWLADAAICVDTCAASAIVSASARMVSSAWLTVRSASPMLLVPRSVAMTAPLVAF